MTSRLVLASMGIGLAGCKPAPTYYLADPVEAPRRCEADRSWVQVSAGSDQSCGIHGDGCIECWGGEWFDGVEGSPDSGTWYDYGADEPPDGAYTSVAAARGWSEGGWHACALDAAGQASCWGRNIEGQSMPPPGTFSALSLSGDFSCGLRTEGELACWGSGIDPEVVPRGSTYVDVAATADAGVCALDREGGVTCGNYLGSHDRVPLGSGFSAIDFQFSVCAVGPRVGLVCRYPESGEDDSTGYLGSEVGLVDVCLTFDGGCVLAEDGHVECWDVDGVPPPERVFTQISCGESHACGVTQEGDMECWGPCYRDTCDVPT